MQNAGADAGASANAWSSEWNPFSSLVKQVRTMVSGDKYRYVDRELGVDLDLCYISDRIIAMGFPAQDLVESTYRNRIDDVATFLRSHHKDKYLVYNCTEEPYDGSKLDNKVLHFQIDDHHPPPLSMLLNIINSMYSWLQADRENVVVLHCKAGKGRTGTIVASYLVWTRVFDDANKALEYFSQKRAIATECITVPSQRRYVHYISEVAASQNKHAVAPKVLLLDKILLRPVPSFSFDDACIPSVEIINVESKKLLYSTDPKDLKKFSKTDVCALLSVGCKLSGDLLLRFYHQPTQKAPSLWKITPMMRISLHTSFMHGNYLDIPLEQLDAPSNGPLVDKRFAPNFSLRFLFTEQS